VDERNNHITLRLGCALSASIMFAPFYLRSGSEEQLGCSADKR